jgi:leucyl aminopeptidase
VQDFDPGLSSYVDDIIERLGKREAYTPKEAQEIMSNLNAGLQNFYKSPNYKDFGKTTVDALVANNLRKSLDDTIEKTSGPQYSALKRVYGSLKAIEKDVNHRAIVDMRKNEKGLIDFTDIFSGSELARSLVSMNPASLAAGATSGFISRLYKRMNDPNTAIKTMFERVKNLPLREAQRAGIEETAAGIAKTAGKGGGYIGANTLPGLFVSPASAEGKENFSVTPKTQQGQKLYQDAQRSYLNKDFQQARDSVFKLMQAEPRLAPIYARSIDLINREEFGMKKRGLI